MFTYTIKMRKSLIASVLTVTVVVLALLLIPMSAKSIDVFNSNRPPKCETDADRVQWLTDMGWEAEPVPITTVEVIIPDEFDELYDQYAIMQRGTGFRLDKHKGKTAMKYSYIINNYGDGEEKAVASILQRGKTIVAAELSSAKLGGFLKPLLPRSETIKAKN